MWSDAEGYVVSGVWLVRSDVSLGNDTEIGLREERVGRSVDIRSRCLSFGKIIDLSGGEKSDVRGFARRESVWRLGSAVSGRIYSRVVKALEERSIFVRSGVARGEARLARLLDARERLISEGNMVEKSLI